MGRPRRYAPDDFRMAGADGTELAIFELTTRTLQSRFLMPPKPKTTRRFLGVLAMAQVLFPHIELYAYHALSNHYSLIIGVRTAEEMAAFMCFLNKRLSVELGGLAGWPQKFWGRRYRPIAVIDAAALVRRMAYSAENSVKEGLVNRADRWPGAHFVKQVLLGDQHGEGDYILRGALGEAKKRKSTAHLTEADFTEVLQVKLSKIPIWNHLSDEEYREKILELAEDARAKHGRPPHELQPIFHDDPHFWPEETNTTEAPDVHASEDETRDLWREAYRAFMAAYDRAVQALRAGIHQFQFPQGGIPPTIIYDPRQFGAAEMA